MGEHSEGLGFLKRYLFGIAFLWVPLSAPPPPPRCVCTLEVQTFLNSDLLKLWGTVVPEGGPLQENIIKSLQNKNIQDGKLSSYS